MGCGLAIGDAKVENRHYTLSRLIVVFSAALLAGIASGCANINSISRKTELPAHSPNREQHAKAVHLDIKQRVVISKSGAPIGTDGKQAFPAMVCAEPSPDALSAFAAAAGGGLSVPERAAGSAAAALHEAAASVGLRTQSITLMRDTLYRLCEAYYNGQLSKAQVMALMARSQDLTATVLAVEQLTGAVAASQAALGGSAGSAASATLVSNAKALEQIRALEKKAKDAHADAKAELDKATADLKTTTDALTLKDAELKKLEGAAAPDAIAIQAKKDEIAALKTTQTEQEDAKNLATAEEKLKAEQLADYTEARVALEQQQDSAITLASASASGTANLLANPTQRALSDKAVEKISEAVRVVVSSVLSKPYIVETCLAIVTDSSVDITTKLYASCLDVLAGAADKEAETNRAITQELQKLRPH